MTSPRNLRYITHRWLMVYGYLLILLIATPNLPSLIRWASSTWPTLSVSRFVLGVEVSIGGLLIVLAGGIFFCDRQKFLRFALITGGSVAASYLFYRIIPNPYELTHLPEYAIFERTNNASTPGRRRLKECGMHRGALSQRSPPVAVRTKCS